MRRAGCEIVIFYEQDRMPIASSAFILEPPTPDPVIEKSRSSFTFNEVRYKTALPLRQAGH